MSIPPNLARLHVTALALVLSIAACDKQQPTEPAAPATVADVTTPPMQTVVVSNLRYPRGIAFDSHGAMYVAEAGIPQGNTTSTVGLCQQTPPPVGPKLGGHTGRISRIDANGTRTTIAFDLPSEITALGDVAGVADLAFVDDNLYALFVAGCGNGHLDTPSSLVRIRGGRTFTVEADLSAWVKAHPTAQPEPDDFEPEGDWYSMVAENGVFYAVEANQGNLVKIQRRPMRVTRLADVSATEGHKVPTAVTVFNNDIRVGELTPFPAVPGDAKILHFGLDGTLRTPLTGFTAVLGVEHDTRGNVYVLESFTCAGMEPCFPSPGSGRVTRVSRDGTRTVLATGLSFATSLRMGPDGALYVSNFGYGPPNQGQIVRIPLGG